MLTRDTWRDLRTLSALARPIRREGGHAAQLEAFYGRQAEDYDSFRERLLPGRRELIASVPLRPDSLWIDLGGGTARNLSYAGAAIQRLRRVYVVDLTPSLLAIAHRRVTREGWSNVTLMHGDATAVTLESGIADVVTCSYSLTMIPDWRAAIGEARRLLKPGGTLGVVDFYVASHHPASTRRIWPWWFRHSRVHLSEHHLPFLQRRFETVSCIERRTRLPYLPLGRVPYYRFVGVKEASGGGHATEVGAPATLSRHSRA